MTVHRITNSVFNSNTYIIHSSDSKEAWVVDCGDVDKILQYLNDNCLTVGGIILTHTHYDHIYGLPKLLDLFPCEVFTSSFGKKALVNDRYNFSKYHADSIILDSPLVKIVSDGDVITLPWKSPLCVYETPGHDKSCISFKVDNYLFTGDSYIPGVKVVATFPNSDKKSAAESTDFILGKITSDTIICPGHGEFCSPNV